MSEERTPEQIQEWVEYLQKSGYNLVKRAVATDNRVRVKTAKDVAGKTIRLGIVSDTHLGDFYQQISHLTDFYRYCGRRKVTAVLHAGDVVCGSGKVYRGQEYEIFAHGADAQLEYAVKNYPKIKGITTYLISGNHCNSFMAQTGYDIVYNICRQREDMEYLGMFGATVSFGPMRAYLMHGAGGCAYARSYKLQRIIEQFPGGDKPNVFVIGHWHVASLLPNYRNVFGLLPACFQSQTPFLRRLGVAPDIGGSILEVTFNKEGTSVIRYRYEWVPYFVPIEKDY